MLNQTALLLLFMLAGFVLCRMKLTPDNTAVVLSKLETYLFLPALNINNFMVHFTWENISTRWLSVLVGIVLMGVAVALAHLLAPCFTKDDYGKRIYRYSFVIANIGYMGNAVIQGVYGDEMLFDYLIYTLPLVTFVYTMGVAWLKPGSSKVTFKTILSPMFISLVIGAVLGLSGIRMPAFLSTTLSSAAACMSPCAMILTGFIIGTFDLKALLKNTKIYVATFVRLIVIPAFMTVIVKLLGCNDTIVLCTLCAYCMPMGLNSVIFPASYGGDTRLGAGMALISHVLSVITIPVMFMLFT